MAKFNFPPKMDCLTGEQIRDAYKRATKPTEWRRVIKLPEGTDVESYGVFDGRVEVSVPPEYDIHVIGPGYPETTTDYRDGQWHGWNGGKCPVDPGDEVQLIWIDAHIGCPRMTLERAENRLWGESMTTIVAFRVISRKPREYTDDDGVTWREVTE